MEKSPLSSYTIRFSDCDPFGHLNNARYIDYFLNAREDHLKNEYQMDLKQFYNQGITWLVGGHEIIYLKPADYNETVTIQTELVEAAPEYLLVDMIMTDENRSSLKAVMRTRFIPVSLKSGKRENHTVEFMDFARRIETGNPDASFSDRVKKLVASLRKSTV